jgi:hypothetical protein
MLYGTFFFWGSRSPATRGQVRFLKVVKYIRAQSSARSALAIPGSWPWTFKLFSNMITVQEISMVFCGSTTDRDHRFDSAVLLLFLVATIGR